MEIKDNLRPDGCFARALPNEPMSILLARDEHAPDTLRKWADLRARRWIETQDPEDEASAAQAIMDADEFERWRSDHDGEWRGKPPTLPWAPSEEMTSLAGRMLSVGEVLTGDEDSVVAKFVEDARSLAGAILRLDPKAGQGGE
jgi:hypothetical protein